MTEQGNGLVDLPSVARRLRRALIPAAVVAVLVGLISAGFGFGFFGAASLTFLALTVLIDMIVVATSALRGADRAQKRGERLASDDVGLRPVRRDNP